MRDRGIVCGLGFGYFGGVGVGTGLCFMALDAFDEGFQVVVVHVCVVPFGHHLGGELISKLHPFFKLRVFDT